MSDRDGVPAWARRARDGWTNVGATRPSFAAIPGPGQESVWDYPRPPALAPDGRLVEVRLGGVILASTRRAIRVLETSHPPTFYLPRADVTMALLHEDGIGSRCEWKGDATYWTAEAGGRRVARGAWSYERPFEEAAALAGHLAFYPSRFECAVDGQPVTPQPGGFYGGWITPELVGPFKGEPGSEGW